MGIAESMQPSETLYGLLNEDTDLANVLLGFQISVCSAASVLSISSATYSLRSSSLNSRSSMIGFNLIASTAAH